MKGPHIRRARGRKGLRAKVSVDDVMTRDEKGIAGLCRRFKKIFKDLSRWCSLLNGIYSNLLKVTPYVLKELCR